jgi:hypothetical protein
MKIDNDFDPKEFISGLEYLLKESKVAEAKIEYGFEYDRLKRRVGILEERINALEELLRKKTN